MPEASFPAEVVSGVPVVTAPEEIDITNAAGLRAAPLEAAAHGSRTLVTGRPAPGPVDVLLVEDDAGDVLLTTEAFALHWAHDNLHVVGDGEQATQFLRRTGDFTDVPRPGLILLDLNLPRRTGLEVLADVKSDHHLRAIPVVILTTSQAEEDIVRSYSLHANAYVTKPVDFERFSDVVRQINDFFLTLVKLPN